MTVSQVVVKIVIKKLAKRNEEKMIYQIFTLELLVAAFSIILLAGVAFTALAILISLIMKATTWLKQKMMTRRNRKRRK